jgi:hypothetical protein
MSGTYQQRALVRKAVYAGIMLVLFVVTLAFRFLYLQVRAEELAMREVTRGDVELGGSALRLVLTGSRGLVICVLSNEIVRAHERNQWNREELITRYLTKLQPHYIKIWTYYSWNLAYNVSVEEDRVKDRYYFMTRGISLIAEGERQNRNNPDLRWNIGTYFQDKIGRHDEKDKLLCLFQMSCMDPLERDPARFYKYDWSDRAGFLATTDGVPQKMVDALVELKGTSREYQDQFQQEVERLLLGEEGKAKEVTAKDVRRFVDKIVRAARQLKERKFIYFCKRHPQFVRRLRERCKVHQTNKMHETAHAVIDFLEENRDVPSLFSPDKSNVVGNVPEHEDDEAPPGRTKMLAVDDFDRFPVLPLPQNKRIIPYPQEYFEDELNSDSEELILKGGDDLDAFAVARTWFGYAQEPLPKPNPMKPGWALPVENRLTQRMPKDMRSILFRQCPGRAQTFIAERLQREGWFDLWDISGVFADAPAAGSQDHLPNQNLVGTQGLLKEAWQRAHRMWTRIGEENYLLISDEELKHKRDQAKLWQEKLPELMARGVVPQRPERDQVPPEWLEPFDANVYVEDFDIAQTLTNYRHFYYVSKAEKDDDALRARRYLFEGDNRSLATIQRVRNYESGLEIWKNILLANKELRSDTGVQEPLYEYQIRQLYGFQQLGGKSIKRALLVHDLLGLALVSPGSPSERCQLLMQLESLENSDREWPAARLEGPLDARAADDEPLVSGSIAQSVAGRLPELAAGAGRPAPRNDKPTGQPGGTPGAGGGRGGRPPGP